MQSFAFGPLSVPLSIGIKYQWNVSKVLVELMVANEIIS